MATIAKRRGRYVLDYYDNRGKRRWQTLKKGTTQKQAKKKLREIEDQLDRGVFIPVSDVPKFNDVAKNWLEYKKANVRGSTYHGYKSHLDNHFDFVNELKINRIRVATVEKFISNRREKKVSLATIRKLLITFGQVMKYAIRHRLIDHNPVSECERPRGQGREQEKASRVLTPDEINSLLDATANKQYRMLFMLAAMTGARQGELLGLKWIDILWDSNQIHIQRTYNNGAWYRPKSKYSNRKVDVGYMVMTELKKWKLACPPNELQLLFPNESGGPLNHGTVYRKHFWPALDEAKLPRIRFHDLRHTYASLLIAQGENIKYIQKQLGHSKPTVTLDIYAHLFDENNPDAAQRLDDLIFQSGSKTVADGTQWRE